MILRRLIHSLHQGTFVFLGLVFSTTGPAAASLKAREVLVQKSSELASALKSARPGDVITLKAGEWKDVQIVPTKGGEFGQPVVLRAEIPGQVTLSGSSRLEINAPYVTVDGLLFQNGAIKSGAVIQFNSHHGLVQNTAIVDYNPAVFETNYYWVFFQGDSNVIDRCYFKGKANLEPLIGNALESSRHNAVVRSYFKNIPYRDGNGREDIRVWGTGKMEDRDDDGAYFLIQGNLFDHADGEGVEIISLKSNYNQVLQNTILATRGCLNIRRGNHNTVAGNIILGQGVSGAEGLRMSGQHNTVRGNFVSHCGYGIRVSCGEFIDHALTADFKADLKPQRGGGAKGRKAEVLIPTYPQVKFLTLTDNVLVGNADLDLEIGADYKKHWPASQQVLLPEECLFENNRFVRPQGGVSVAGATPDVRAPLDGLKFLPNRFVGNVLLGGTNRLPAAAEGFATREIVADWSEAKEAAGFKPLNPDDVGPAWIIARRQAGDLSLEGPAPAGLTSTTAPVKKHKARGN